MNNRLMRLVVLCCGLFISACLTARAGAPAVVQPLPDSSASFERGMREFQFGMGFAVSQNFHAIERPQLNDADVSARLGWMINNPTGGGIWRGNIELLAEVFGGAVVKGPGDALVGTTLLLRRNMIFRGARLVPYYQIGGGGVYSDAHEDRAQHILGSPLLFDVQGGLGARYLLSPKCALYLELDWRHISNAGLAERNVGLNSVVGWLGASCFF